MTPIARRDLGVISVTCTAPAKLNLTLAVVGRRSDGYHALHSVMAPLDFGDELTVSAGDGPFDGLEIEGADLPVSADNLVLRGIAAARAEVLAVGGVPAPALDAMLAKRIPVAAGLAGGSSDAAAAIAASIDAWQATISRDRAIAVAASVGSDVPFFFAGGIALVTGRGESVEPLPHLRGPQPAVLLVTPGLRISTPAVFSAYAAGARPLDHARARAVSESLASALRRGLTADGLLARAAELATANDLLPAARVVAPELAAFHDALADLLGRPVGQSGSGPTLWALYESMGEAEAAAHSVEGAIASGDLPFVGSGPAFVVATSVTAG